MARPRLIDRDRVVQAALDHLDEVGPSAFSINAVAARIGVTTPALYNYFSERAEILRAAATYVFGSPHVPRAEDYPPERYEDYVVARCLTTLEQASAHPSGALLLLEHIPLDLVDAGFCDMVALMTAAGVPAEQRLLILEGAQKLVWGWVLLLHVFDRRREGNESREGNERSGSIVSELTKLPAAQTLERSVRALIRGVVDGG